MTDPATMALNEDGEARQEKEFRARQEQQRKNELDPGWCTRQAADLARVRNVERNQDNMAD